MGLKSFENRYVISEHEIEQDGNGAQALEVHSKAELMGMANLYKYIKNYEVSAMTGDDFSIFELQELHRRLFAYTPYPEAAGKFRNISVFLPGSGISISQPERIIYDFIDLSYDFEQIMNLPLDTSEELISYVQSSVILSTKLIKIHPFNDGNGRSIRGLLNLMFKKANIPPVYISPEDNVVYRKALESAMADEEYGGGNYDDITSFYLYKICDSLIEITDASFNKPDEVGGDGSSDVKLYKRGDLKKYSMISKS